MEDAEKKNAVMGRERSFLTSLCEAALRGDGMKVQSLVSQYSADHGDVSVREVLTQFKDARGRTALHFACQSLPPGKSDSTSREEKDKGSSGDILHELLLSKWAKSNHVLSNVSDNRAGSILRVKDKDGLTPLMLASQLSQKYPTLSNSRVQIILSAGGPKLALARSKDGAAALHYAAGAGASRDTILALYDAGKVAARTCSRRGGTPLHWAAGAEHGDCVETVETLLNNCFCDVDAKNEQGLSPLILAAAAGNDKNGAALVRSGADRGVVLSGNVTVYHMAADLNLVATLTSLLAADEHVLQKNKSESFDESKEEQVLSVSQQCCAIKNGEGETPLELAANEGHLKCVAMLLPEHGGRGDDEAAAAYIENHRRRKAKATPAVETMTDSLAATDGTVLVGGAKGDNGEDEIARIESRGKRRAEALSGKSISDKRKEEAMERKKAGNEHFRSHHYEDAIEEYAKAIDADPTNATFYSNRSACHDALEHHAAALEDAVTARYLDPKWAKACYRVAVARLALGLYEDAALAAWEGVQLDQENDELKSLLQKAVKLGKKEHQARVAKQKLLNDDDDKRNVGDLVQDASR